MNADHTSWAIIYRMKTAPWNCVCVCVDPLSYGAPFVPDVIDYDLMLNSHLVQREESMELERPRTVHRTRVACRADLDQKLLHSSCSTNRVRPRY